MWIYRRGKEKERRPVLSSSYFLPGSSLLRLINLCIQTYLFVPISQIHTHLELCQTTPLTDSFSLPLMALELFYSLANNGVHTQSPSVIVLFRVLFLFCFIHMYHLFSKIKLQATWRQRQKLSAHIPWSIKLLGTELSLKKLTIQFADLWVYGRMWTYHFAWRSKAIVFNLPPSEITLFLLTDLLDLEKGIFFQLEQLR